MSPQPKFSILTPTYNCAAYLTRSYASLRQQTISDWEWILIDDGSTDNTENIVKQFKDDRIRYVKLSKNKGRGFARSEGLKHCKAPFIAVWDADDIYPPKRFETALQMFKTFPDADFFCSYTGILDNDLHFQYPRGWISDNFYKKYFVHHTLIAKKDVIQDIGYPSNLRTGEDFTLVMTLSAQYKGIFHEEILAFYLENREVSALKALKSNIAQLQQFIHLYQQNILPLSSWRFIKTTARLSLKISVIGLMCFYPPLYLHTIKRRNKMTHTTPPKEMQDFLDFMRQSYPIESS